MPYAIKLITVAFVLYTGVIFAEKIMKKLTLNMVVLFAIALIVDMIGSSIMGFNRKFCVSLHTVTGIFALIVMMGHFIWAILALWEIGNTKQLFTTYSIYAWVFWLTVALSGMFCG